MRIPNKPLSHMGYVMETATRSIGKTMTKDKTFKLGPFRLGFIASEDQKRMAIGFVVAVSLPKIPSVGGDWLI